MNNITKNKIFFLDAFFVRSLFTDLIKRTSLFSQSNFFLLGSNDKIKSILKLYDNLYQLQDDILSKTLLQLYNTSSEYYTMNYKQLLLLLDDNLSNNNNLFYNHLQSTWIVKPQSSNVYVKKNRAEKEIIFFLRNLDKKLVLYGIMNDTRVLNIIYENLFILNKFFFNSKNYIPKEFVDYTTWVNIWLTKYLIKSKSSIFNLGMCLPIRGLEKRTKRVDYFHYSIPFIWQKLKSSILESVSKQNYLKLYKLLIDTLDKYNLSESDKHFLLLSKNLLFSTRLSIFTKYNSLRSKGLKENLNQIHFDFGNGDELKLQFDTLPPLKVQKDHALVNQFDISLNSQGILFGKLKEESEYTPFVTISGMEFLYCISSLYMYLCLELSDSFYPLYLFSHLSPDELFTIYPNLRTLLVPISKDPDIYLGNEVDVNTGHFNCSMVREDEVKYHQLAKKINLWTIADYIVFNIEYILKLAQTNGILFALKELYEKSLRFTGKYEDKKTYDQIKESLDLLNYNSEPKKNWETIIRAPISKPIPNKWNKLLKERPHSRIRLNLKRYEPPNNRSSELNKYVPPYSRRIVSVYGGSNQSILEKINKYNKKVLMEFNKKNKLKYKGLKKSELILEIKNKLL